MKSHKDQLMLLEHLNKMLRIDNARPEIIQLSELGLVELTRRRKGKSLSEIFNNEISNSPSMNSYETKPKIPNNEEIYNINSIFFKKKF